MSYLAQIKRRKIFQVAAVYAVISWLLIQIVATIEQPLNLPDWFDTSIIVVLAVGFPIVLIFSWVFDVTTKGLVWDEGGAKAPGRSRRIEYILIGLLIIAVGWIGYRELTVSTVPAIVSGEQIAIAVLPFENLSADPDQEFFSDGITVEIQSALARVRELAVIGRTSAFQFKNEARDLREIGRSLGATHLIEGSVSRAGTRVRVTAQLIRADSGIEIWSDSYNPEIADVFAMQEEIARDVAASLQQPLGLGEGERLVANRAISADDHLEYLRASALFHSRGLAAITEAAELLQGLVTRNPNYAPAWALLAQAYDFIPNFEPAWLSGDFESLRPTVRELMPEAEEAANRAIELDESLASGYYALALALEQQGELGRAEDLYQMALARDRDDPDALHLYSRLLAKVGYLEDAWTMRQRLLAVDPFVPVYRAVSAWLLWLNGRDDEATEMARNLPPPTRGYTLSRILASKGLYGEAADIIESDSRGMYLPGTVEEATRLLRVAPAKLQASESFRPLGLLAFVYLYVGVPEHALVPHERGVDVGYSVSIFNGLLWHPSYAELRKSKRFKEFLRNAGLVDYWRDRGWPDFCRPLEGEDIVCD